jgi:aspartate racemase
LKLSNSWETTAIKVEFTMKVIGLIGGMTWNSTMEYYRVINDLVARKLGGLHSAQIVLYSLDFAEIEQAQREENWDIAADILNRAGIALREAGADFLVICANTMHKVADLVAERSRVAVIHIADVAGSAITEHRLHKVGLLGTKFVMEEPFYRERLQKGFGVDVLIPEQAERDTVHRIIYEELSIGKIKRASRQACLEIIEMLTGRGAEGIILGCTELPLLIRPADVSVPLFDTTQLHAEAAVTLALSE